ncbi:hypothetical protein Nepgr_002963 [Nepenthes gracilis]|uniref:Bidirectional sugar transporter SWEET n=1 Tax=Nepenthes gracilis TaxID=150966 RepID=A0AAD3XCN6_NEPGR|nr:hypothetical protein Nepgr_002963 [Nepenthes gracilis]
MLWIVYALFDPVSTFLISINSFICFLETLYIVIFLFYATREDRIITLKLIMLMNIGGFGFINFMVIVIIKDVQLRLKILGWLCVIFSLCVFGAPLCVMREVIRTKSVKHMPLLLSFFLVISAVLRFFYGLFIMNYYIAIPNVLGFCFGIAQMVLYAIYRNSKETMDDSEGKKLPELTSDQIIKEVIKLNSINPRDKDIITAVALRAMAALDNREGICAIRIHNVNEPVEASVAVDAAAVPPAAANLTLAV